MQDWKETNAFTIIPFQAAVIHYFVYNDSLFLDEYLKELLNITYILTMLTSIEK